MINMCNRAKRIMVIYPEQSTKQPKIEIKEEKKIRRIIKSRELIITLNHLVPV